MNKNYGFIYEKSKEKDLHLIDNIFEREKNKKYFLDLFSNGFTYTNYALLKTEFKVIANNENIALIDLYEHLIKNFDSFEKVKYDWISSEQFKTIIANNDKINWYVTFVKLVWGGKYLYDNKFEEQIKIIHNKFFIFNYHDNYFFSGMENCSNYHDRKIILEKNIKNIIKNTTSISEKQHLKYFLNLKHLDRILAFDILNKIKSQNLTLLSFDWLNAIELLEITNIINTNNTFVLCVPPKIFDYKAFWRWFDKTPYSSYIITPVPNVPAKFPRLIKNKQLYWNGKGKVETSVIDSLIFH